MTTVLYSLDPDDLKKKKWQPTKPRRGQTATYRESITTPWIPSIVPVCLCSSEDFSFTLRCHDDQLKIPPTLRRYYPLWKNEIEKSNRYQKWVTSSRTMQWKYGIWQTIYFQMYPESRQTIISNIVHPVTNNDYTWKSVEQWKWALGSRDVGSTHTAQSRWSLQG